MDGAFNGDPHPGNILLTPDGKLGLIDYGQASYECVAKYRGPPCPLVEHGKYFAHRCLSEITAQPSKFRVMKLCLG